MESGLLFTRDEFLAQSRFSTSSARPRSMEEFTLFRDAETTWSLFVRRSRPVPTCHRGHLKRTGLDAALRYALDIIYCTSMTFGRYARRL